jgi:hypothetical protein
MLYCDYLSVQADAIPCVWIVASFVQGEGSKVCAIVE